ncbi:MAG: DUF1501 domain-containing protein [Rothia sp. (in: high G+C Gram-positive bacteria)]|nr:DUF1501 domain-containing protein [Rothia sp. (in: high G+C Gram-positive bacteria)]
MKPLNTLFLKADDLHQVHHHSGDDNRNFLVDTQTGQTINSLKKANEIAAERLSCNRRTALTGASVGVLSLSSVMLTESAAPRYAYAAEPIGDGTVLIMVYLRGGADGLSLVTPYADSYYTASRKTTRKTPSMAGAKVLDSTFMLAPELSSLTSAWVAGDLSIVHSVGLNSNTRSHFSNYKEADRSAPVQYKTGWLARLLDATTNNASQFRAFSHAGNVSGAFYGTDQEVLAISSFADFKMKSTAKDTSTIDALAQRINSKVGGELGTMVKTTLSSMTEIQKLNAPSYVPENGASYPKSDFGQSMKDIAQILKANKGVQVVTVDQSGWDTHRGQASQVNLLARDLGDALGAFYKDMGPTRMNKVVLMTVSEFGRTTLENASLGTDHGAGNFSFILSGRATGKVAGGQWIGLKNARDKDNAILTDYRALAAEVMSKGLGIDQARISQILPDYSPTPVGVLS